MARWFLTLGTLVWLVAGLVAFAVAIFGTGALQRLLPPLAIDADALGGAVTAVGIGLTAVAAAHAVALAGLRSGRRWGWTSALLLSGVLAAAFVTMAASAWTSVAVASTDGTALIGAGLGAAMAAAGYGLAALRLVVEGRSGSVC